MKSAIDFIELFEKESSSVKKMHMMAVSFNNVIFSVEIRFSVEKYRTPSGAFSELVYHQIETGEFAKIITITSSENAFRRGALTLAVCNANSACTTKNVVKAIRYVVSYIEKFSS